MITIKHISSKKELKQFVMFPFRLYKNCKYWVPPLINDEMETYLYRTTNLFNPIIINPSKKSLIKYPHFRSSSMQVEHIQSSNRSTQLDYV